MVFNGDGQSTTTDVTVNGAIELGEGYNQLLAYDYANVNVEGDVKNVSNLYTGYQSTLTAKDVTGTIYNDSVSVGYNADMTLNSLDMAEGYNSLVVSDKAELIVAGNVAKVNYLYSGWDSIVKANAVTGTEYNDSFTIGSEASMTLSSLDMAEGYNSLVVYNDAKLIVSGDISGVNYFYNGVNSIVSAKAVTGTEYNDTMDIGYESKVTFTGLDLGDGYDVINLASGSTLTIDGGKIANVEYISGYGATIELKNGASIENVENINGMEYTTIKEFVKVEAGMITGTIGYGNNVDVFSMADGSFTLDIEAFKADNKVSDNMKLTLYRKDAEGNLYASASYEGTDIHGIDYYKEGSKFEGLASVSVELTGYVDKKDKVEYSITIK